MADNPGFMVGIETEQAGSIRFGADLMIRIASLKTRKMCIVVRRAYTAGLYAMAGAGFNTDTNIAKLIYRDGRIEELEKMQKEQLAHLILDKICILLSK